MTEVGAFISGLIVMRMMKRECTTHEYANHEYIMEIKYDGRKKHIGNQ